MVKFGGRERKICLDRQGLVELGSCQLGGVGSCGCPVIGNGQGIKLARGQFVLPAGLICCES